MAQLPRLGARVGLDEGEKGAAGAGGLAEDQMRLCPAAKGGVSGMERDRELSAQVGQKRSFGAADATGGQLRLCRDLAAVGYIVRQNLSYLPRFARELFRLCGL